MNSKDFCIFFVSLMILLSSCNRHENCSEIQVCIEETDNTKEINFFDMFSEVSFIPLENNMEGMISDSRTLCVNDNGFVIFFRDYMPHIIQFDCQGKFVRKIGKIGRAKTEIQDNVLDVCTNEKGDTIALSTFFDIKLYNNEGKYLSSTMLESGYGKSIVKSNCGFVYSSEYSSNPNSIHFLDDKGRIIYEMFSTEGNIIGNSGYVRHTIRYDNNRLFYLDQYRSVLYQINSTNHQIDKTINLCSKNALSIDKFKEENVLDQEHDGIFEFNVSNDEIFGHLLGGKYFELDLKDNTLKMYRLSDWYPTGCTSYNGYYYYVISQNEFLSIGESKLIPNNVTNNYNEVSSYVNEKSNCVIMKLKR